MVDLGTEQKTLSYTGARSDIQDLVGRDRRAVLDVGCATGTLGAAIKARQPATVAGIEFDPEMAAVARQRLDAVAVGDLNRWADIAPQLGERMFDCVICGDVLEHLVDPWSTLRCLASLLSDDGYVVVSLPNVGHFDTLWNVFIRRRWPNRDRGIHDVTHLRWFARKDIASLMEGAGLRVVSLTRIYRIVERPSGVNRWARLFAAPGLRDLFTFQFLVLAEPDHLDGVGNDR